MNLPPVPGSSNRLAAPDRILGKLLAQPLLRPLLQEFLPAEGKPVIAAVGQKDLIGGVDLPDTIIFAAAGIGMMALEIWAVSKIFVPSQLLGPRQKHP